MSNVNKAKKERVEINKSINMYKYFKDKYIFL